TPAQFQQDVLFVGEVKIKGSLGDARDLGDFLDRGLLDAVIEAPFGPQPDGGPYQPAPRLLGTILGKRRAPGAIGRGSLLTWHGAGTPSDRRPEGGHWCQTLPPPPPRIGERPRTALTTGPLENIRSSTNPSLVRGWPGATLPGNAHRCVLSEHRAR